MEATGVRPGKVANFISATVPRDNLLSNKCLKFKFNAYGIHVGEFRVFDEFNSTMFYYGGGEEIPYIPLLFHRN